MTTKLAATLAAILLQAPCLRAETLTMNTTYPAPSGVYQAVLTTGGSAATPANTVLVRDAGNVGIGTTSPLSKLHIFGSAGAELSLDSPTPFMPAIPEGASLSLRRDGLRKWSIWNNPQASTLNALIAADALVFSDASGQRQNYIFNPEDSHGTTFNVLGDKMAAINLWGTGTSGSAWYSALTLRQSPANGRAWAVAYNSAATASTKEDLDISFWPVGGKPVNVMMITPSGLVGIDTPPAFTLDVNGKIRGTLVSTSDARLKKNIQPLRGALELLLRLRGVTYEWKEPAKHDNAVGTQVGVIAQEVEKVRPGWVTTGADGYKAVGFKGFEGVVVEGLRELKNENDSLRAENKALERRIAALEKALPKI
jgi:hypothetical protein